MQCCWLWRWRKWAGNRRGREASKTGVGKEHSPRASRRACSSTNTLISAQWDPCQSSNIPRHMVNICIVLSHLKVVVIHFSSNRTQTHHAQYLSCLWHQCPLKKESVVHSVWKCSKLKSSHRDSHAPDLIKGSGKSCNNKTELFNPVYSSISQLKHETLVFFFLFSLNT